MTRFVAISLRSYHTWRMRLTMTILLLAALAFVPVRSEAFDLEETLRAQHVQYEGRQSLSVAQQGGMTLAQAIESVKRRTNGRVISAETRVQGGREVHVIKVLANGKVTTHRVNGRRR